MIYPGIGELVAKILQRRKNIYLCTNGMFIQEAARVQADQPLLLQRPPRRHGKTHDIAVEREGVFDAAIDGIKAAKEAGFLVCTNTTVFKETDMAEIDALFAYLTTLGVDGFMISPAYGYAAVQETNPKAPDLHDPRRHPGQVPAKRRSCSASTA